MFLGSPQIKYGFGRVKNNTISSYGVRFAPFARSPTKIEKLFFVISLKQSIFTFAFKNEGKLGC